MSKNKHPSDSDDEASQNEPQAKRREPDFDLSHSSVMLSAGSGHHEGASQASAHQPHQAQGGKSSQSFAASSTSTAGSAYGSKGLYLVVALFFGYAIFSYLELSSVKQQLSKAEQSLSSVNMLTEAQYGELADSLDNAKAQRTAQEQDIKDQLKFLDSEMRKLWVIAHQTNQPRIEALEQSLASIKKTHDSVNSSLSKIEAQQKTLEKNYSKISGSGQTLGGRLDKVEADLAEAQIRVADIPVVLEAVKRDMAEVTDKVDQVSKVKAEFDEHRQRLNRSVDQLFDEIRALKGAPREAGL